MGIFGSLGGAIGGMAGSIGMGAAGMGIGGKLIGGLAGSLLGKKGGPKDPERWREEAARLRAEKEKRELDRLKGIYEMADTSNPYTNMENTMEDLTINQKQADFQRQSFQQSQANILSSLRGAASGSGIASLAQSLARQGQIAAQKSAASIGQQEAQNKRLAAQQAAQLQQLERQGDVYARNLKQQTYSTLMGMTQQEYLADREAQFNYFATHKKADTQKQLKAMEMAEQGMKAGAGGGLGGMLGGGGIGGLFGSIMGYGG
tara:strand:+ start:11011 stop:11793 length:783 start_codon:yes stop_codon:yes gene_type:complete